MANTYKALSTVTVGAGGASTIAFTNIPQTYTDLVIKVSGRFSFASGIVSNMAIQLNNSTATFTNRTLSGSGSAAGSGSGSSGFIGDLPGALSTGSTFGNSEIYIPNYVSGNNKSIGADTVSENNGTVAWSYLTAALWSTTNPITSVTLYDIGNSSNFVQYTTATLYGVFNADVSSAPATPTIGSATATGTTTATVAFTEVSNAASYTATSTPGSITTTGTTSPIAVTGLTTDTSYTFTVKSNNPFGSSANSAASNSITPSTAVYESIATATVGAGGVSTVTFSSIPQTYTHLQIRFVATGSGGNIPMTFNSSGSGYTWHYNAGTGSATQNSGGTSAASSFICHAIKTATNWTSGVCDITEYTNTNKGKTFRSLTGVTDNTASGNWIITQAGIWNNTNAITSITLGSATLAEGTKFALYGVRS